MKSVARLIQAILLVILGMAVLLLIYVIAQGNPNAGYSSPSSPRPTATRRPASQPERTYMEVQYIVTSTSPTFSLTYSNAQGGTVQEDISTHVPWKKTYAMQAGDFAYISAQSTFSSSANITCQIMVNGVQWKTTTSKGKYVIATCSGSVGRP